MMGAFGQALIFLTTLIFTAITGLIAVIYGSHCFLVILEQTAAAEDTITWPDEPINDWIGKCIFLGWLVFLWCVVWYLPVQMILRSPSDPLLNAAFIVFVIWLMFPLSLLSSLTATSRWMVLHGQVLRGLLQHAGATLIVYLISALLLGGLVLLWFQAVQSTVWIVLVLTGVATSAALLIYARLLGRLGWFFTTYAARQEKKKNEGKKKAAGRGRDPWNLPQPPEEEPSLSLADVIEEEDAADSGLMLLEEEEEEEDEWGPPKPYVLMTEEQQQAAQSRKPNRISAGKNPGVFGLLPDANSISSEVPDDFRAPTIPLPADPPSFLPPALDELDKPPRKPINRLKKKQLSPHAALWQGIYTFPFQADGLKQFTYLAVLGCVLCVLLRILREAWPF